MALLHRATLRPTKLELLTAWLPDRPWYRGAGDPVRVTGFRFDDPDGEVGIETLLVRAGNGPLLQVPVEDADPTTILTDVVELTVRRVLDGAAGPDAGPLALTGTWSGQPVPVLLAQARIR